MRLRQQPLVFSLDTVRKLALHKQQLDCRPRVADKQAVLSIVHRIGLLQLDSINVVARSHYLVILSRAGLYQSADLDSLLYPDRRLFEQFAHAACLIPIEDYRYFAPLILSRRAQPHRKLARLGASPQDFLCAVLMQIRNSGPLRSRDFEDPRAQRGSWWDWKPAKLALEILFEHGYLMVDRRVNFQRYYDLTEQILPTNAEIPAVELSDWSEWATLRSVECLGVATISQIADYYRQVKTEVTPAVQSLVTKGDLIPAVVEGWKNTAYLSVTDLPIAREIEAGMHEPAVTTFLSPFDNLIWDRKRTHDLFHFDYRIEVYKPINRERQYGYYVLPILNKGHLVGRLDAKAHRGLKRLIIRALYLEPDQQIEEGLLNDLQRALYEFAAFNQCGSISIERSEPEGLAHVLRQRF